MIGALNLFDNEPPAVDEPDTQLQEFDDKFVIPDFSQLVASYEFDFDNSPVAPAPVLLLDGHTISTPGNITNIQAQAKAGKSSVIGGIISSVIVGDRDGCDTLGFSSQNPQQGYLLHFDTEQSRFDSDANVRLALKRAKIKGKPPWLRAFCLTEIDHRERYNFVTSAIEWAAAEPSGLFMVIIDGVADLCIDPNNAEDSNFVVQKLHKAAIKSNCGIVTVLHENPGSDIGKMRGHLGSQLERKAETALRLFKDTTSGIVTIWAERARHCMIPKSAGYCIRYDENERCFVSCGSAKEMKNREKLEMFRGEISAVFDGELNFSYNDLCNKIMEVTGLKKDSAKKRVKEWTDAKLIHKLGGSYFSPLPHSIDSSVKV
jgi:hypothetical protein